MAAWLREQVGPTGRVVAADIQTAFLQPLQHPALEIRRHDIAADDIRDGGFDPVHARWVLHWVQRRAEALRRMVAALRPGGWLAVEEPDMATLVESAEPAVFRRVVTATMGGSRTPPRSTRGAGAGCAPSCPHRT